MIPKAAREQYGPSGGARMILLGDEKGLSLIPAEEFETEIKRAMTLAAAQNDNLLEI